MRIDENRAFNVYPGLILKKRRESSYVTYLGCISKLNGRIVSVSGPLILSCSSRTYSWLGAYLWSEDQCCWYLEKNRRDISRFKSPSISAKNWPLLDSISQTRRWLFCTWKKVRKVYIMQYGAAFFPGMYGTKLLLLNHPSPISCNRASSLLSSVELRLATCCVSRSTQPRKSEACISKRSLDLLALYQPRPRIKTHDDMCISDRRRSFSPRSVECFHLDLQYNRYPVSHDE